MLCLGLDCPRVLRGGPNFMMLPDKVAIITGGGRGLGRSIALAFGREGAKVVVTARTREQIEHVVEELRSLKKDAIAIPTDVSDEKQVYRLVERTIEVYGTIDILVNNAGSRGPIGPFHKISLEDWERTLRSNLTATFLCTKAVLPVMMGKKEGKIINITTTLTPRPNLTPYMVAKAGVTHFTKQLYREVKDFNIRVYAIHPGVMDTQMQEEIRNAGVHAIGTDMFVRMKEEGILRSPDEPAHFILLLASDAANALSGEFLSFDGKIMDSLVSLDFGSLNFV